MQTILVTGGAGYIGSHTVVALHQSGYRPIIIDNFVNSERGVLNALEQITGAEITLYEGEYQDPELLNRVLQKEGIEGIIHFAAHKAVAESVEQPLKYYKNNVAGLITLIEAMETAGIKNLVFSSSCTVYGEPDRLPITEDAPLKQATSPYGATKQIGEVIIRDSTLASSHLKSLALRYFNPIGAHPSGLIGELPIGTPANLVPFLTQAVAGIRSQLTVYGDDYPTPDGTCIRDYIHVEDLAQAHVKALEHITAQPAGYYDTCNIGTGTGSSVLEVIKTFEEATGKKVPFSIGSRRPGDIIQTYASADKAKSLLNWQANKTLKDALADAWNWQQQLEHRT